MENTYKVRDAKPGIIAFFVVLLIAAFLMNAITIIPTNSEGVKHLFGKVYGETLSEGIHVINPLSKVEQYTLRTQEYTMVSAIGEGAQSGVDTITAKTKENTQIGLDITVLYHLDKTQVKNIWENIGSQENIITKIVRPIVRTKVRDVVSLYTKDEVNRLRLNISLQIQSMIEGDVKDRGVVIEQVLIRNIVFPVEVQNAINAKEEEKELAEKMVFTILKETKEAERRVIEAEGISKANKIIATSLTDEYLRWYWIDNLDNYDSVIYVPVANDGMPIFKNVDSTANNGVNPALA